MVLAAQKTYTSEMILTHQLEFRLLAARNYFEETKKKDYNTRKEAFSLFTALEMLA
jgi:hypothetical protein